MLAVDLNDRERPASPGPSPLLERKAAAVEPPEAHKPKQWRLKIEEWLQENEKEQERERKLRDKIALERRRRQELEQREAEIGQTIDIENKDLRAIKALDTLHEVKTDSEIYANKAKGSKYNRSAVKSPELPEGMPLKDKSRWRKSNLNVANSSESIDDERRRSRSIRNVSDPQMDTIRLYIRSNNSQSAENIVPCDRSSSVLSSLCPETSQSTADVSTAFNSLNTSSETPIQIETTSITSSDIPKHKDENKNDNSKPDLDRSAELTRESDPGVLIGRSRFYKSMKEPCYDKIQQASTRNVMDEDVTKDLRTLKTECNESKAETSDNNSKNISLDKDEEGNFDRFSYMRKTTRRAKSRNKTPENERRKLNEYIDNDTKGCVNADSTENRSEDIPPGSKKDAIDMDTKFMDDALKEISQSSKEIQNLSEDKNKHTGNIFTRYISDNNKHGESNDEQKKKDKSLKARLSKRLLSLTENLKVIAKPTDTTDSCIPNTEKSATEGEINLISESPCPKIEKMLSERRASLNEEKVNPIMEHREKILSRPRQDMVQVPPRNKLPHLQTDYTPIIIAKPQFIKESYISDTNNVKIAHAEPVTHDVKELEAYPAQKGKEESEKDEGFEETQSQLSEAASQGAGSNYDTDLADSPRSVRQAREANAAKLTSPVQSNETEVLPKVSENSNIAEKNYQRDLPPETEEKSLQQTKSLKPDVQAFNRTQSMRRLETKPAFERNRIMSSSVRLQNARVDSDKSNPKQTASTVKSKTAARPQIPSTLRSSLRNSEESVSSSGSRLGKKQSLKGKGDSKETVSSSKSRLVKKPSLKGLDNSLENVTSSKNRLTNRPNLKGLGNLSETSPKIGRRVAAYTKAIKSMTNNLRGSKNFENYDVTQSMPPTPSEENKSFASGLNLAENGKKARSSSSVCSPRSQSRRSSERSICASIGSSNGRDSEKSLSSKRSSDRSLNLSRKSSEASVITVKSANRSPMLTSRRPKPGAPSSNRITASTRTKAVRPVNTVQTKQLRVPTVSKPVARSNSVNKPVASTNRPNTTVRRTSSDRSSCAFMRATSASSAKTAPTKNTHEQKIKTQFNQRTSKAIPLAKVEPTPNKMKQRC